MFLLLLCFLCFHCYCIDVFMMCVLSHLNKDYLLTYLQSQISTTFRVVILKFASFIRSKFVLQIMSANWFSLWDGVFTGAGASTLVPRPSLFRPGAATVGDTYRMQDLLRLTGLGPRKPYASVTKHIICYWCKTGQVSAVLRVAHCRLRSTNVQWNGCRTP